MTLIELKEAVDKAVEQEGHAARFIDVRFSRTGKPTSVSTSSVNSAEVLRWSGTRFLLIGHD